jgi:methyl-accepting chemotaxis protein
MAVGKIKAQNDNIKKIFEVVNETVAKINLLSINTAIIADKSNTKSDGLKVVAKEMQILAEQTKYSSSELSTIISSFMTDVIDTENILNLAKSSHEQDLLAAKSCEAVFLKFNKNLNNLVENVSQLKEHITLNKSSISKYSQSLNLLVRDIDYIDKLSEENGLSTDEIVTQSQKVLDTVQMSHNLFEKHMQLINQTITEASDAVNLATQSMSKCGQLSQNALVFEGLLRSLVDDQEPQA